MELKYIIYGALVYLTGMLFAPVFGHGKTTNNTVNNYYVTEVTEITEVTEMSGTSITSGVSDSDLADGLAAAMAAGAHQFDFSTYRYQASIAGAFDAGESADAVSFGLGKRFEGLDALFSGSYTRVDDHDFVVISGTFRF